jgi:hypothetical protein
VYQPEINMCRIDVDGGEGWLNRSDINPDRVRHSMMYGVPLDCMWVIRVKEGWKVRKQYFCSPQTQSSCLLLTLDMQIERAIELPSDRLQKHSNGMILSRAPVLYWRRVVSPPAK